MVTNSKLQYWLQLWQRTLNVQPKKFYNKVVQRIENHDLRYESNNIVSNGGHSEVKNKGGRFGSIQESSEGKSWMRVTKKTITMMYKYVHHIN